MRIGNIVKKTVAAVLAVAMLFTVEPVNVSAKTKTKVKSVKILSPAGSKKIAYVAKGKKIKLILLEKKE